MENRIGLTWGLSSIHGWGVFGINLVKELLLHRDQGWPEPLLLNETQLSTVNDAYHPMLAPLIEEQSKLASDSANLKQVGLKDVLVLHSCGNELIRTPVSDRYVGERNFGFTFFEETNIPDNAIEHAKNMDGMLTGSKWNADHLRDQGIKDVTCIHQGVDIGVFQPRPPTNRFGDKFVVFAAGKLEYRKAQDLVVSAFKKFITRRPDALLVTVWQNPWPESAETLNESKHISSLPNLKKNPADAIMAWTKAEGIPEDSHIDLGIIGNADLPHIMCDVDIAVFPNRCEGGTNLALMECMASGIPCVVSMNSGHLDIATAQNCLPLHRQSSVDGSNGSRGVWGESDIDEIVEQMDAAYRDRARSKAIGLAGMDRMHQMTWGRQIGALIKSLEK